MKRRIIKSLWVALATLSALLAVVSCVKDLAVKEQEVSFESSLTTEQSQIVKGDSTVTTQLLINEDKADCPRPTKYSVSFTYDEEAGTLFFLGNPIQSGKPISLSSLSDLALTYQAKKLVGNKVDVTVTNDAPKELRKELVWNILAEEAYWVKSEQEGDGEITITGCDDLDAVKPDTKLAVSAKPADGWELVALTANDVDILEDKSFVVTENTTVCAVFTTEDPETYAVTLTKEGEGKVAITGANNLDAVVAGAKLTVTATPADGWEVKIITANGKDITTDKSFVVTSNTIVKVVFKKQPPKTYKVTLVCSDGGEATITGADDLNRVPAGTKLNIITKAGENMELESLTINGVPANGFSFVVTEDTVVKVTFKAVEVVVPLPADPQGPPLWLLVKYIFVDESGSDLPIPFSQYWQYVSVESYPLLNLTIDVNKPQSFDIPEGYERISWYGDFGENVVVRCVENEGFDSKFGPFWRISLKKPLSDYDLTGITVNSVSENHVTRRPIPLTSSSGNSSLIQTFPKLADSYDLTGSPTFRTASPRKTRNYPYLEIKYHFKRK